MSFILVLLIAIVGVSAEANKYLPPLPRDFSLVVEANILAKEKTHHLIEWHSESLGKSRFQFINGSTTVIEVFDFNKKERYEMLLHESEPFNCTTIPLNETSRFSQQRNFSQIFQFGDAIEETYRGPTVVRGIKANHWTHVFSSPHPDFPNVEFNFTQDFYFSDTEWTVDGFPRHAVPLRSIVEGTFNGTDFSNHYEFGSFRVGNPPNFEQGALFGDCTVQMHLAGFNNNDPEHHHGDGSNGVGLAVLLLIVGLAAGAVIGAVAVIMYKRRQVQTA